MSFGEIGGVDTRVPGSFGPDASLGRLIESGGKVSLNGFSVGGELADESMGAAHHGVCVEL